jgi:uncharacterized protein YecA (UPF0149 family)
MDCAIHRKRALVSICPDCLKEHAEMVIREERERLANEITKLRKSQTGYMDDFMKGMNRAYDEFLELIKEARR